MRRKHPPKSKCQKEDNTKPVFTFQQMERVVDLIDRQARLIAGERFLPVDEYVYAKNENKTSLFVANAEVTLYTLTLDALKPAIDTYNCQDVEIYVDGVVGVYYPIFSSIRYRIYLNQTMYAKYDNNTRTVTINNIPLSTILDMESLNYISRESSGSTNFYTKYPIDYHRDYPGGCGEYI